MPTAPSSDPLPPLPPHVVEALAQALARAVVKAIRREDEQRDDHGAAVEAEVAGR